MKAKLIIIHCGHGYWTWMLSLGNNEYVQTGNTRGTAKAAKRRALTVAKNLGLRISKVEQHRS